MNVAPVLRLESVSKRFRTPAGPRLVLDRVSLEVEQGQSVAITGPSGCGKSTLLGIMAGLEPPTDGRVWLGDRELSALSDQERARVRRNELGLVYQSDNLLPFLTAVENVSLQLALGNRANGDVRCAELLSELGLAAEQGKLPDQLSGGQRQRVAVARALVHGPRVVLADEPTGSLDSESSADVVDCLMAMQRQTRATLVIVTHDLDVAKRMDIRLGLRDGRLEAPGVG